MFQNRKPRGILAGAPTGYNPYENASGDDVRDKDAVYNRLKGMGLLEPTTDVTTPPFNPAFNTGPIQAPSFEMGEVQTPNLPKVPPDVRSTDPWSKANVRRTLLDISAAFGGANTFGEGIGRAAGAIGSRMDELQAMNTPQRKFGVGPDGSFEAITDPVTGETTYQRIPEFEKALEDERRAELDARNAPTREDILDQRARAIAAIRRLPANQQAAAYQRLLIDPQAFGGIDTSGMPQQYDPMWASVVEGMGLSTNQALQAELRERDLARKAEADRVRATQGGQRLEIARNRPPPRRAAPAAAKLPSRFILD
jgi:hypothetical protein